MVFLAQLGQGDLTAMQRERDGVFIYIYTLYIYKYIYTLTSGQCQSEKMMF